MSVARKGTKMQTFKLSTLPVSVLLPTPTFRYKEIKAQELLLDTILPPEFKLQQLHVDIVTGKQIGRAHV